MCRSKAEGGRRCRGKKGRRSLASVGSSGGFAVPVPVSQVAQDQAGDFVDAVVDAGSVDSAAFAKDVAGQVADEIASKLAAHGYKRGRAQGHLLCGALAAVAQAMKAGEDAARAAVIEGVTAALMVGGVTRPVAGLAGRAAADVLMKQTPARHWEDVRRAVEALAVAMCPDVDDHPEVREFCLEPVVSAVLSSALTEGLAGSPPDGSPPAG